MSGITITGSVTINTGVSIENPPTLMLSLDAVTYDNTTTGTQQNVSGTSDNVGFFPYGWPAYNVIQIGWTCVQTGAVVSAVDAGNHTITTVGTPFTSGDSYTFTSSVSWIDSVSNRTFILNNGVTYSGSNGGILEFNPASGQYAQCASSLSDLSTWSVEVWHYYTGTNTGANPCIITELYPGSTGQINYFMGGLTAGSPNLQSGYFNGGFQVTPGGYTLTTGNWYQIVGTYDGATVKLYVNDTLVEQATATGSQPLSSQGGINLMRRWDNAEFWGGNLGIVKIYDGAMNAAGVNASWNANNARFGLAPPAFTTPTVIPSAGPGQLRAITVNSSGKFVAVGYLGGNPYPLYSTSTNGSNWTVPAVMNGTSTLSTMTGIAVNSSGLFVAVGATSSGNYGIYSTSSDGSTWIEPALMNGVSTFAVFNAITVNSSGLFVAVGFNGSSQSLYSTSTDGSNWITPIPMFASTVITYGMKSVAVNSAGLFVAVGYDFYGNSYYSTSSNGSTWTEPALMNGVTSPSYMASVTVNSSGRFVAVGNNSGGYSGNPMYATSTNGSTWTSPSVVGTNLGEFKTVTVDSSGVFIAAGWNNNRYPIYATSVNGINWSNTSLMNGYTTYCNITCIGVNSSNTFVALGFNISGVPLYAIT